MNRDKKRANNHAYYIKHREKLLNHMHAYNAAHRKEKSKYDHAWYISHRGEINTRARTYSATHREETVEYKRRWKVTHPEHDCEWRATLRAEVLSHYGGKCVRCGAVNRLHVHHVNFDGGNHRKKIGSSSLYHWLKDNHWPSGFELLCPSCHKQVHRERRIAQIVRGEKTYEPRAVEEKS
jgi:predicted HNH restriction endonuclease